MPMDTAQREEKETFISSSASFCKITECKKFKGGLNFVPHKGGFLEGVIPRATDSFLSVASSKNSVIVEPLYSGHPCMGTKFWSL